MSFPSNLKSVVGEGKDNNPYQLSSEKAEKIHLNDRLQQEVEKKRVANLLGTDKTKDPNTGKTPQDERNAQVKAMEKMLAKAAGGQPPRSRAMVTPEEAAHYAELRKQEEAKKITILQTIERYYADPTLKALLDERNITRPTIRNSLLEIEMKYETIRTAVSSGGDMGTVAVLKAIQIAEKILSKAYNVDGLAQNLASNPSFHVMMAQYKAEHPMPNVPTSVKLAGTIALSAKVQHEINKSIAKAKQAVEKQSEEKKKKTTDDELTDIEEEPTPLPTVRKAAMEQKYPVPPPEPLVRQVGGQPLPDIPPLTSPKPVKSLHVVVADEIPLTEIPKSPQEGPSPKKRVTRRRRKVRRTNKTTD